MWGAGKAHGATVWIPPLGFEDWVNHPFFVMEAETSEFEAHPGRGRFNAAFFHLMDGYINWHVRKHKQAVYADLPRTVVEIGSGVGANFRYMQPGTKVIAVEPNPYMHRSLRLAAERHEIDLEIRDVAGERIDAAQERTLTRGVQRAVRRPWAWVFEGCSCERDLESVIRSAGFSSIENRSYRIHSPFVPFNTHITGTAVA